MDKGYQVYIELAFGVTELNTLETTVVVVVVVVKIVVVAGVGVGTGGVGSDGVAEWPDWIFYQLTPSVCFVVLDEMTKHNVTAHY